MDVITYLAKHGAKLDVKDKVSQGAPTLWISPYSDSNCSSKCSNSSSEVNRLYVTDERGCTCPLP